MAPVATQVFWDGFMPRGSAILLAADGGMGKSTLATELAAMVTVGTPPPGGPGYGEPRGAVIVSTEEDGPRVIVPRLMQAGADMQQVQVLAPGDDQGFLLPRDQGLLLEAARSVNAGMIVVDTGMDILEGNPLDTQDVGRFFACLNRVSSELDAVTLVLHHLNKLDDAGVWEGRITGISGWRNKPRGVLVVGEPEGLEASESSERVLASGVKSNLIHGQRGALFTIVARPMEELGGDAIAPLGARLGAVQAPYDPNELLRNLQDRRRAKREGKSPKVKAREMAEELLGDAPGYAMWSDELKARLLGDFSHNAVRGALAMDAFTTSQPPGAGGRGLVRLAKHKCPRLEPCPGCGREGLHAVLPGENLCGPCGGAL